MTDGEEDSGVPRRHILYLGGSTVAAAAGATAWGWPHFKKILAGRDEPGNFGDKGDDGSGTERPPETTDGNYDVWQDAIPEGCSLPGEYENAIEEEINNYDGMESGELTEYVNSGRVDFLEDGSELRMLVDEDNDGQYDHEDSLADIC